MNMLTVTMKIITLLLGTSVILFGCSEEHKHQPAPFDGSKVLIDSNHLREEIPVFYSFHDGKVTIHFFVLKIKNEIHSYFDACNKCYRNKLGYRYVDGSLICNACSESYSIFNLKDGLGGCYPIKLEGTLSGSMYEIERESLIKGKKYFQ